MEDWKADITETLRQLGQSRTVHYILDNMLVSACPPLSQLDEYYADKLSGPAVIATRRHLVSCDRCARELLLREQITDDLIEGESMELIQEVYATEKSLLPTKASSGRSKSRWQNTLAERRVFLGVASAILFLLFLLLMWAWAR